MKRFLILSILIVFVIAGCAAPNKVGWKKPDFRQDEFEKDREDCIQAAKVNPEQNISVEQCLAKKGYESEPEPKERVFFIHLNLCVFLAYLYLLFLCQF